MPYQKRENPTSMTRRKFADNLSDVINESGKSIREISEETGIATGTLSKYQNDGAEAGIDKLAKLADYFNVSADWLLGRTETRSPDTNKQAVSDYLELTDKAVDALRPADKGGMLDGARHFFFNLLLCDPQFGKFIEAAFDFGRYYNPLESREPGEKVSIYGQPGNGGFEIPVTVDSLRDALMLNLLKELAPVLSRAHDCWYKIAEKYAEEHYTGKVTNNG